MDVCTLLYFTWITNKDLLYSTGNPARCPVAAWMGGEHEGEWKPVYAWLSPYLFTWKLPQYCLLISSAWVLSHFSWIQLYATLWSMARQAPMSWGSPGKNSGVGHHALLQGIFLTQGSNPHLFHLPALPDGFLTTVTTWEAPTDYTPTQNF